MTAPYPHCDSRIVHAQNTCKYCDNYPELQRERIDNNINFTNTTDPNKALCPAIAARGERVNYWQGNRVNGE